ncbi:MAG: hypothetical protein WA990_04105 [Rubrobacteraceae bacterium]
MSSSDDARAIMSRGVRAASLLEATFSQALTRDEDRRLELVRDLTRDIKEQLEVLASPATPELSSKPSPGLIAEAALRCADLANLAACNLDGLPGPEATRAGAGVRLAAETVQALRRLSEERPGTLPETHPAVLRDIQGSGWRADLAVRQTDERVG